MMAMIWPVNVEKYQCILKIMALIFFSAKETWLSAHGDEARIPELASSRFHVKSFPRQSRSRGDGIATIYKSNLGSNITFNTTII